MTSFIRYDELRGVLRYEIIEHKEETPEDSYNYYKIGGPFTNEECLEFIRTHRKGKEACCWEICTYDMDGYEDEALWRFLPNESFYVEEWMRRHKYSMERPEDYQLELLHE